MGVLHKWHQIAQNITNNASHFPLCQDAFSATQTLQLMNIVNYNLSDSLFDILIMLSRFL